MRDVPISYPTRVNGIIFIEFSTFGFANFHLSLRNDRKVMWLSGAKKFLLSDICSIHFHITSNASRMAGNRDPENQ